MRLLLIFALTICFSGQSQSISASHRVFHSINQGLANPEQVVNLELNGNYNNDSLIFLKRFSNLETLTLVNHEGPELPLCISNIVWLKRLRLINDNFYSLPVEFSNLVHLEAVELVHDTHLDLQSTFLILGRLPELKELRIEGLSSQSFSSNLTFPPGLEILSLRDNHLNSIPFGIKKLNGLKLLDVGSNELLEIPNFLIDLKNLDVLYLDHQPFLQFDSAFEILGTMDFLRELHLEGNHLSTELIKNELSLDLNRVFLGNVEPGSLLNYQPNLRLPAFPKFSNQPDKASFKINF